MKKECRFMWRQIMIQKYTFDTVADSKETYLLVAINKNTDTVEAAIPMNLLISIG